MRPFFIAPISCGHCGRFHHTWQALLVCVYAHQAKAERKLRRLFPSGEAPNPDALADEILSDLIDLGITSATVVERSGEAPNDE